MLAALFLVLVLLVPFHRVGCLGVASSSQKIRLDLDNELEDARWFTRTELLAILADPKGTVINRHEQAYFNVSRTFPPSYPSLSPFPPLRRRLSLTFLFCPFRFIDYYKPGAKPNDGPPPAIPFRLPPRTAIAGVLASDWAKGNVRAFEGRKKEEEEVLKGRI